MKKLNKLIVTLLVAMLCVELWDEGAAAWAVAFFDEVITYYETAPDYANMYDVVAQSITGEEVHLPWTLAVNVL